VNEDEPERWIGCVEGDRPGDAIGVVVRMGDDDGEGAATGHRRGIYRQTLRQSATGLSC
jgi:hypothetical protein